MLILVEIHSEKANILEIKEEIQEIQENIRGAGKGTLENLLKDNIVGQLGKFGLTFLKSGFDQLNSI